MTAVVEVPLLDGVTHIGMRNTSDGYGATMTTTEDPPTNAGDPDDPEPTGAPEVIGPPDDPDAPEVEF
jgi:hypothetical protein